jgi:Holliday junction DNA helicase RuvA
MLRGTVVDEQKDRLILEVGGVGYEVIIPPHQMKALRAHYLPADDPKARLMNPELSISLYIYHHASERNPLPVLFGFTDLNERRFFELLTTVSNFGPIAATKSMTIPVGEYASRIMTRDVKALCQLPGIGTAKAEQMIAKLRSKMALFAMMPKEEIPDRPAGSDEEFVVKAQIALEDLGYRPQEAERMIDAARKAKPNIATIEDLLDAVWALSRERK